MNKYQRIEEKCNELILKAKQPNSSSPPPAPCSLIVSTMPASAKKMKTDIPKSHYVTDLGFGGAGQGARRQVSLLSAGYKGEVPKGYFAVKSPTFGIWFLARGFLVNGAAHAELMR